MPGTSRLFPCGRLVPGGWAERRSFSGEGGANRATTPATRTTTTTREKEVMSEKAELIFEEPPEPTRPGRPSRYMEWLDRLRQHPNVWAKHPIEVINPSRAASNLRKSKNTPPGFEIVGRRPTPGRNRGFVYARYVGGGKA